METFVRGYEKIDDPEIDSDDEILNWTFSETAIDFSSALWLLASGFYKASASSLRTAFEIATVSLYFQIRENMRLDDGKYNSFFSLWDSGLRDTPNWREMKPVFSTWPSVVAYKSAHNIDIVQYEYDHFKYLCAYTHTNAFDNSGRGITAINTTGSAPTFDVDCFNRGCELITKTISLITIFWQIVFPLIAFTKPLGELDGDSYKKLFVPPHGLTGFAPVLQDHGCQLIN